MLTRITDTPDNLNMTAAGLGLPTRLQKVHQNRNNVGQTRPSSNKDDLLDIQASADLNTFSIRACKKDPSLSVLGPAAQLLGESANSTRVNCQGCLVRARDGEGVPLDQRHGGHTDIDMLTRCMGNRPIHPKPGQAVMEDSRLSEGHLGLDTPSSEDVDHVENDSCSGEPHCVGSVETDKDQEYQEQGVADNEGLIGKPTHRPSCCNDQQTEGGVGGETISNLGGCQLLRQQSLPRPPRLHHTAHMDRDEDKEREA